MIRVGDAQLMSLEATNVKCTCRSDTMGGNSQVTNWESI